MAREVSLWLLVCVALEQMIEREQFLTSSKSEADVMGGGKGALIQTDLSATLATNNDQYLFQPVAYSFDSLASNSMKSCNPHSGCRQVEVAKCIDTTDPNPSKNQGGIAIVQPTCKSVGVDIYNLKTTGDKAVSLTTASNATGSGPTVAVPYTLEPSIAAREGGHIYEGVSGTLRANAGDNQMAVAYPVPNILLDDQGGQQINVRTDDKCPTLRAEAHGNMPAVVCESHPPISFQGQAGAEASLCIGNDVAASLVSSKELMVAYSIENHPADSRVNIDDSGKVQTLTSRMGTGGGNVPMVMEQKPVYCLQGNGIDRADTAGCNGKGWKEDTCYTLNTIDRPAVAYGIETFHCNTEEEKVPTLKARDWKDPNVVVYAEEQPIAIDRAYFNQGQNDLYDPQLYADGTNPTLVARGPNAVAVREGENSVAYSFDPGASRDVGVLFIEECGKTLTNGTCPGYHDGVVIHDKVAVRYIVRRLTPTECARLQGFPDRWGDIEWISEDVTGEEPLFWREVYMTDCAIKGKKPKPRIADMQNGWEVAVIRWHNQLHTDSAEYKMWGNGIALPPALYCMQGMAEALEEEAHDEC